MKKILIALFAAASMIGVAHAQTNTTITQDTANTARATCFSNGGTADQCQATYDAYIQAAGTSVPNSPTTQTPQPSSGGSSGFVALAPIPGLTDIQYAPNGLAAFFNNLYKFAIGIAATLAVVEIIWGGLNISTQDSVSKKEEGKERIQNAIFGLVLVLSPVLVFSLINPNILNLSLNLPKIDLTTPTVQPITSGSCTAGQPGCTAAVNYTNEKIYLGLQNVTKAPAGAGWCYGVKNYSAPGGLQFQVVCVPTQDACTKLTATDNMNYKIVGACEQH